MLVFSTLFNVNYIDKALVLIHSLKECGIDFKLYAFAFDDECYRTLSALNEKSCIPISLKEFENKELLTVKKTRSAREYCWTCSCHTIKYVLEKYNEPHCTYIDVDMYFYSSPECLIDEIKNAGCDVGIIEHRMPNSKENRRAISLSGVYCVEFNTFFNTENGLQILNWWCDRCIECCTSIPDEKHFGDQKYLNDWTTRFNGVHVIQNLGAGVAPWNIAKYVLVDEKDKILRYKATRERAPMIFYHFQSMEYMEDNTVDIRVNMYPNKAEKKLCYILYREYIDKIEEVRKMLIKEYDIDLMGRLGYSKRFSKKNYFKVDLLYERDPFILVSKIWRIFIRKKDDYISLNKE